jgi:hypothetical protein
MHEKPAGLHKKINGNKGEYFCKNKATNLRKN